MEQRSPLMVQSLAGRKDFKSVKEVSKSIALIKIIERICYNYQLYELAPLVGWGTIGRLTSKRQPDNKVKSDYYKKFKTFIKVCGASRINFSVLC